jgi:serine protease
MMGLVAALLLVSAIPMVLTWRSPASPAPSAPPTDVGGEIGSAPRAVVVDLKDDATAEDVARLEQETGLDLELNSAHSDPAQLMRAELPASGSEGPDGGGAGTQAVLAELRSDPAVEYAEPDHLYKALWTPNDTRFREQWNFRLIGAEKAWDVTRGKGAMVAVIDTGVAFENDDKGCYQAKDFARTGFQRGYDFIHNNDHPNDDQGHGTHVAGTIAETTNNREGCAGIAPEAKIMPLKVLSKEGYGTTGDIADAVRYAADHGAHVINMSLGSPFPSAILHSACQYAFKKGVTIVCAAGNSGTEGVGYPAAFKECIAVSAVGPGGKLTPYSSYGPQIAIAAPGGDKSLGENAGVLQNTVLGGEDNYYWFQGTSMASPHVAGVAALLVSQGIKDPAEVKAALQKAARPKAPANKYGAGLLDASAAVARTQSVRAQRPVWWLVSLFAVAVTFALGTMRRRLAKLPGYPTGAVAALVLGLLGPDWLASHFGFDHHINMVGHSLLLPALLLTEVESRASLRWVAALAAALTAHLLWDLRWGTAPFPAMADWQALVWLCANTFAGVLVVAIALSRVRRAET